MDTKEIDVCGSKYSCSKQDDYACLNMKGNQASAIYDGNCGFLDNYYTIKKTVAVSEDHCSKIPVTPAHKCICDDGCNHMDVFFVVDKDAPPEPGMPTTTLGKLKCDAFASTWGKDKCKFY